MATTTAIAVPAMKSEIHGWYLFDWSNSAYATSILAAFLPNLFSTLYGPAYFTFCVSASVICQVGLRILLIDRNKYVQVILFIMVGGMADWGSLRKPLLVIFSTVGALMSCLFFTVNVPGVTFVVSPSLAGLPYSSQHLFCTQFSSYRMIL
jgi:MFS-type transporter involved in bile tolerance (Atg22 family)